MNKEELGKVAAEVLSISSEKIDFNKDFREMGIDSLYMFSLVDYVETKYNITLDLERMIKLKNLNQFYDMLIEQQGV